MSLYPRTRRAGITWAALAGAVLALAACSSSSPGRPVANLPGHHGGHAANGHLTTAQGDHLMIMFTRCMRAHGVPMRDPFHIPGHAGLSIEMPTQSPSSAAAYQACNHFLQPIIQMKNAHAATVAPPELAALTRYARCMRGHDISMLDPTSYGGLNLGHVPGITSTFGRYSPQFRAADQACRHFLPAGVHDTGTGP